MKQPEIGETINPDQNLFDQPPLDHLISALSEHSRILTKDWHVLLGVGARHLQELNSTSNSPINIHDVPRAIKKANHQRQLYLGRIRLKACVIAWKDISQEITQYPELIDYVGAMIQQEYRHFDGTLPKTREPREGFLLTPTYPTWLAAKNSEKPDSSIPVVLAETFPQRFAESSIEEVIRQIRTGKPRARQEWPLLHAAEITKDRR